MTESTTSQQKLLLKTPWDIVVAVNVWGRV